MVKRVLIISAVLILIITASLFTVNTGLQNAREINVVHTTLDSKEGDNESIRIAFLPDFHITWNDRDFERFDLILEKVRANTPDIILLGGDFTGEGRAATEMIRNRIVTSLEEFTSIAPTYTVLGNHEWWTGGDEWFDLLDESDLELIEGQQVSLTLKNRKLCLRGLGDAFTDHNEPQPFKESCEGLRVTLTHDPYALVLDKEKGVFFSGHTHCSQIKITGIKAFWTPTQAPHELWCGWTLYEGRASLTTTGLGTSFFPLRFGTTSGFDVITIQ